MLGSRNNYAHSYINNIGLVSWAHPEMGVMGFDMALGGIVLMNFLSFDLVGYG